MVTGTWADRILQDKVLLYLGATVALLLVLTVLFGLFTVLLRLKNNRKAHRWVRLEHEWQPIVLQVISGERPVDELTSLIRPEDEEFFLDFLLRYAMRFRGEERMILCALAKPFIGQVLRTRRSRDPEDRARAVQLLSHLGLPEYAREMVGFLDDPSPLVAMMAARSLAQKEFVRHAQVLLDHLYRFDDWSSAFLAAMLSSAGEDLAPSLQNFLGNPHKPASSRAVVAEALIRLNEFSAAGVAARIIKWESNVDLVAACLRLLGAVGGPDHLDLIRSHVESPHFSIRAQAIGALGRLGEEQDVPVLRRAFMDHSPWVAIQAATALKGLGAADILEAVAQAPHHPRHLLARQVLENAA